MRKNFTKILTTILLLFIGFPLINAATGTSNSDVQLWYDAGNGNPYIGSAYTSWTQTETKTSTSSFTRHFVDYKSAFEASQDPSKILPRCNNNGVKCTATAPRAVVGYCRADSDQSDCGSTYYEGLYTQKASLYAVTVTSLTDTTTTTKKSGIHGIYNYKYKVSTSCHSSTFDYAYCIQPSKNGPGSSCNYRTNYSVASTFDVKGCKNSLDKSVGYSCGLAQILYFAKEKGLDGKKFNEANNDDYNAISTALRMWVVYWFNNVSKRSLTSIDGFVHGDEYSSKPVYYSTVKAALNGYTGEDCSSAYKKYGQYGNVLCYSSESEKAKVINAIKLFNQTLHSKDFMGGKWEGVENIDAKITQGTVEEAPVENPNYKAVNVTATVTIKDIKDLPDKVKAETLWKEIRVACDPNDPNYTGKCSDYVLVKDVDGNTVRYDGRSTTVGPKYDVSGFTKTKVNNDEDNGKYTGEDTIYEYSFKVNMYYYRVCKIGSGEWTELNEGNAYIEILSPYIAGSAKIIQYVHGNDAKNYQVMMSYSENIYEKLKYNERVEPGTLTRYQFDFDCDPETCSKPGCSDLSQKTDAEIKVKGSNTISSTCDIEKPSSLGYQYKTIEDPNMGCIINSCNKEAENYEITSIVGANSEICHVYNRKDTRFYISNSTNTYAGMQFRFDLGKQLQLSGIISSQNSKDKDEKGKYAKLTSVVLEKEQITSVFDAATYDTLYAAAKSNGNSFQMKKLKYDKYNCMMYSASKIESKVGSSITELKNEGIVNSQTGIMRDYLTGAKNGTNKENYSVSCADNSKKCINLNVSYDEKYDLSIKRTSEKHVNFDKDLYRCTGSKCFDSQTTDTCTNNFKENNSGTYGSGKTTYTSLFVTTQNDYYLDTQFYYEAYTGNVTTDGNAKNVNALPKYTYPINSETETNIATEANMNTTAYKMKYSFTNINANGISSLNTFNYTCPYSVYNITKKNSCNYKDEKGNAVLSLCSNSLYTIEDGVVEINKNGLRWNNLNKYSSGIIYRNVNLENLFPRYKNPLNGKYYDDSDILQYKYKNNWFLKNQVYNPNSTTNALYVENIIENIENTGNNLYSEGSDHLKYSYTLTSDSIEKIKEYNQDHSYLNASIDSSSCKKIRTGVNAATNVEEQSVAYYECKSNFLKNYDEYGIIDNMIGGAH